MTIDYFVYDVFTTRAFGGNQLAVIPDATTIPEPILQDIAREFGYSETVFLLPSTEPGCYRRARIFTPTMEVPFAGHPTIGTIIALHDLGGPDRFHLELGVGPIACDWKGGLASFHTNVALETFDAPDIEDVAACLGLRSDDISKDIHPPIPASVGLPFILVELTDAAALGRATPQIDAFRHAAKTCPLPLDFAIYCYIRAETRIDARMFAPLDNIPEDPATGSAAAALGAFLVKLEDTPQVLQIVQGTDMGRPSTISVFADRDGVTIRGGAVKTMTGTLHIPV